MFKGGSDIAVDAMHSDEVPLFHERISYPRDTTEDAVSWITNKIRELGMNLSEDDMSDDVTLILRTLLIESHDMSATCSSLRLRIELLERSKEADTAKIGAQSHDLQVADEKITAMRSEHREVKCLWLSEKSELDSRCFQLQALQTQLQGTLRKREKDLDRLQAQLARIARDGHRTGCKGTPVMVLTQPLKKNSSQREGKRRGSILDAELAAAHSTICTLEEENGKLRLAMKDLTASFEEFQAIMTKSLLDQETLLEGKQLHVPAEDNTVFGSGELQVDSMSCLEQARHVEQTLDVTSAMLDKAVNPSTSRNGVISTAGSVHRGHHVSNPAQVFIEAAGWRGVATPATRPLNWLVQQANSEVKGLRARAEKLYWKIPDDNTGESSVEKVNMASTEFNSPPSSAGSNALQVRSLQTQLEESLRIIYEMDRLVHAALVGNLTGAKGAVGSSRASLEYTEEDDDGDDDNVEFDEGNLGNMTPSNKMRGSYDLSDWSMCEVLPPVSPDTMVVLQAANFSTLPPAAPPVDGEIPPEEECSL